jgi:uncharacterized protein YaaQ
MKQLVIIVQADDADPAADALRDAGHRFTRLASEGGFLGTPNVTMVMVIKDEALEDVVAMRRATGSSRDVEVPLVLSGRLRDWQEKAVTYGGAMVIVTDAVDVIRV